MSGVIELNEVSDYAWEDISVGDSASFEVTITDEMMASFRLLTGDINPLHVDTNYAQECGYDDVVVYGMLVSSFYSSLVGVCLPGKRCLLQSINARMHKPVFIGDSIVVNGTVAEKHEAVRALILDANIKNSRGEKVNKARIQVGVI